MTHKSFYEAAAAEVAAGQLGNAPWIKVNAAMPGADNSVRQAKYVALRAQELATANTRAAICGWLPRTKWQWGRRSSSRCCYISLGRFSWLSFISIAFLFLTVGVGLLTRV